MHVDRVTMGSPLTHLRALIFLQSLEKNFNCFKGNMSLFYTTHFDDIIFAKNKIPRG